MFSEAESAKPNPLMNTYGRIPLTMKRGKGSWLWDGEGRKYLDYTTGIAVTALGHCHPEVTEAIRSQSGTLLHTSNLFNIENQYALAQLLVSNSFADRVFFCNSGTEAVEGSIKLARKWGSAHGGKYAVISTLGAFHGRTLGALSATGSEKYKEGFSPLVQGFHFAPYADADAISRLVVETEPCAVILEPVQGENGVVVPPEGYLGRVRDICTENGVLLVLDEIQTGIGRTGRFFACEHEEVEPDIMAVAKSLGGGVPCGAVLAREDVAAHFIPGIHGSTFGGNPLACAAACAVIKTILGEGLVKRAEKLGNFFLEKLEMIMHRYPEYVREVRGAGLMLGLEFKDENFAGRCFSVSLRRGLLVILTVGTVFRILPPLNTSEQEIEFAVTVINESIDEVISDGKESSFGRRT